MEAEQDIKGDTIVVEVPKTPKDKSQGSSKQKLDARRFGLPYEASKYFSLNHEGEATNGPRVETEQQHAPDTTPAKTPVNRKRKKNLSEKYINEVVDLTQDSDPDVEMTDVGTGAEAGTRGRDAESLDDEVEEIFPNPTSWTYQNGKFVRQPPAASGAKQKPIRQKNAVDNDNDVEKIVPTNASKYGGRKGLSTQLPPNLSHNSTVNHKPHPRQHRRTQLGPKPVQRSGKSGQDARKERGWPGDIVQPIDPSKAIFRTKAINPYNPDNIAHHVLKVLAPTPDTPGALNSVFWSLTKLVGAVDENSDLSTFRWDIFDAGRRTMPPALPQDDPHSLFPARQDYNHGQPLGMPGHAQQQGPSPLPPGYGPPHPNGIFGPRQNDHIGMIPPRPQYVAGPTGAYHHDPSNQGSYGQISYQPQGPNHTHPHSHPHASHTQRPSTATGSGLYPMPNPSSNDYYVSPTTLNKSRLNQPPQVSHPPRPNADLALPRVQTFNQISSNLNGFGKFRSQLPSTQRNGVRTHSSGTSNLPSPRNNAIVPPLDRSRLNQNSSNSSVQDSSEGHSNAPSPLSGTFDRSGPASHSKPISDMSARFSQMPKSAQRGNTSGDLTQTPQSAQRMGTPNSVTKSGKVLFRFSKEQRAILEKSATKNMSPNVQVKRQLAQEVGVDLKRVNQFFSNCQAGNYPFAKRIKEQGYANNGAGDDARSISSADSFQTARMHVSSSPNATPTQKRGRPPLIGSSSKLAIVIDASDLPVQFNTPSRFFGRGDGLFAAKKRGRPFATAEAAARAADKASRKAAGTYERKKSGRPAKVHGRPVIEVPEATFHPFYCEWKGCPAELHNLESLQAHVKYVHRRRNDENLLTCRWAECGEESKKGKEFEDKHDWAKHIADVHIARIARRMGDGPKGTDLSLIAPPAVPSWLKDSTGKIVTPSIANQPIEQGKAKRNNKRRLLSQIRSSGIAVVLGSVVNPDEYQKFEDETSSSDSSTDSDSSEDEEGDAMEIDGRQDDDGMEIDELQGPPTMLGRASLSGVRELGYRM